MTRLIFRTLAAAAVFLMLSGAGSARAQGAGSVIPWFKVPPAVQQTIQKNVGEGNRVQKVLLATEESGAVYRAIIVAIDGSTTLLTVGARGQLLGSMTNKPEETAEEDEAALAPAGPKYATMKPAEVLKIAETGDAEAQYWAGKFYAEAMVDGTRNYNAAFQWYQKAADQGNHNAQDALGRLYIDGRGTPQDYIYGYFWRLVGAKTNTDKEDARKAVEQSLSPRQMFAIEKQVPYWKPGQPLPLKKYE